MTLSNMAHEDPIIDTPIHIRYVDEVENYICWLEPYHLLHFEKWNS